MANDTPVPPNRTERILRNMAVSAAGLSVLAILANIVAGLAGIDRSGGAWPVVVVLPLVGLPIAFLFVIAFTVVSFLRRRREQDGR